MKIECQSCGAAYKIADEKVQGKKVFKIKCKKCSSDIIVRGADPGVEAQRPLEDEATRALPTGGADEPIWHVVVNGEQQGPFSLSQVQEMLGNGTIDAEAYVWRDGFDGWSPLQEVSELAAVFAMAPAPAPAAVDVGVPAGDLFAAPAPAPVEVAMPAPSPVAAADFNVPEPARAQSARPASAARAKVGGGDLFAAEARAQEAAKSMFTPASEPAAPPASPDSMTGQRNENSVLFSLATLQQLSNPKDAPAAPAGTASGDSSGLIDINKLAGALNATPGSKPKSSVDDLLTVGASSGLSSPLAAPVLAPVAVPVAAVVAQPEPVRAQQGSKNMTVAIVAAALILVAGGLGAAFIVKGRGEGDSNTVAANTATPPTAAPVAAAPAVPTAPPPGWPRCCGAIAAARRW